MNVVHCARCGGNHKNLKERKLKRPIAPPEADPLVWTHWARCPTRGEPILVSVVEGPRIGPSKDDATYRSTIPWRCICGDTTKHSLAFKTDNVTQAEYGWCGKFSCLVTQAEREKERT